VIAAAKTFGVDRLLEAVAVGARDLGENYVQEARRKQDEIRSLGAVEDLRWHMIGRLQRNKAKQALEVFDLIHSLEGDALARDLDRAAAAGGRIARCLIEVNLGGEGSKGGTFSDQLGDLLGRISSYGHLIVEGLMAIPPPGDPRSSRTHFAQLRELRQRLDGLRLPNVQLKELSMGMSSDFETAIEEGATMVRIGTAIFGPRSQE